MLMPSVKFHQCHNSDSQLNLIQHPRINLPSYEFIWASLHLGKITCYTVCLSENCTFFITCSLYLAQPYFNCIVVPIFDYCDTRLILVLLRLITLSKHCHFHTIVQVYKILHHLVATCLPSGYTCMYLCFLMDILVGTVIVYVFLECRPLINKTVRGAVAWNNIDQTLYSPTSLNYLITCCMVN